MKITEDLKLYLDSTKFSNGLKVNCAENNSRMSRLDYLELLCKDKKVIHLGACDHLSLIDAKIKQNRWLHKRITKVAKNVIGVDIVPEAVEYCNKIGYSNIKEIDLLSQSRLIKDWIKEEGFQQYDLILLGEILEHLENPVEFLKKIKKEYVGIVNELIITVPNVYFYRYSDFAKKGIECINTDHKYNFSPFTLCKIVQLAGMQPNEILFADFPGSRNIIKYFRKQLYNANTLICIVKI